MVNWGEALFAIESKSNAYTQENIAPECDHIAYKMFSGRRN